jgi:hypothetical protein
MNDETQIPVTETEVGTGMPEAAPAKKPRAPKRVAVLVVGEWKGRYFEPAATQPTGAAQREMSALSAWLRKSETIEALMGEGLTKVDVIRKELITATFAETKILKASVR